MPDVRGKRVLVFGDSLSASASSPGGVLAAHLRDAGATVQVNAVVGRSAFNFYSRENSAAVLRELATFKPELVVVELGTNDIGLSMRVDAVKMAALRHAFDGMGAEVWAFGPPSFPPSGPGSSLQAGAPAVVDMMRGVFGPRFLDLRPLSADLTTIGTARTADGVHFTSKGAARLGARMADELQHGATVPASSFWMIAALVVSAWYVLR